MGNSRSALKGEEVVGINPSMWAFDFFQSPNFIFRSQTYSSPFWTDVFAKHLPVKHHPH